MTRKTGSLSPQEVELWNRVAATVEPLEAKRTVKTRAPTSAQKPANIFSHNAADRHPTQKQFARMLNPSTTAASPQPGSQREALPGAGAGSALPPQHNGLDGHWDRKFVRGRIEPDITVDLHGHTLSTAYTQLDQSLALAIRTGFRVLLLITGKPRPADARDARGNRRGVIRAAVADWLASSRHAANIAAVRNAHPRHGGNGALYIVLRR